MKTKGFTLIEMIFVIVILGILSIVGVNILQNSFQIMIANRDMLEMTQQMQHAFRLMDDEMVEIKSNKPSHLAIKSDEITFINVDGTTINYKKNNDYLTRNNINLASSMNNLNFDYFDSNNDIIINPESADTTTVRCIKFSATSSKDNAKLNFETVICPRGFL